MKIDQQEALIRSLPSNPIKPIIWVVYNEHMVDQAKNKIREIKGVDYMINVSVVSKSLASKIDGTVYFDPNIYEQLSNGYD